MNKRLGEQTILFENGVYVNESYSIAGIKEGHGNFEKYFDSILTEDMYEEKSFEKAERKIMQNTIKYAMKKAKITMKELDLLLCGDLLNQIISSSFSARQFNTTYIGLYGACSTMVEAISVGACFVDGGYFKNIACATTSHFSTAERQLRFPLELGNQRTPTSQWTITGGGCTLLTNKKKKIRVANATFGKVVDFGIKDVNNMGAAMAPAAMSTLLAHFKDTNTTPSDYDLIITGDLGKLGSEILMDLMENKGFKLDKNYHDCGQMIFKDTQKTFQGGSGSGCCALILNSYIYKKMLNKEYKKVLFCATGALLSTLSSQQGDSIPGICHAVELVLEDNK